MNLIFVLILVASLSGLGLLSSTLFIEGQAITTLRQAAVLSSQGSDTAAVDTYNAGMARFAYAGKLAVVSRVRFLMLREFDSRIER